MTEYLKIRHASVAVEGAEACQHLQRLIEVSESVAEIPSADLSIANTPDGLHLKWFRSGPKPLEYHLDFEKTAGKLRSFPAPKQGAFNQALGKRSRKIIDATGGWGGDALLMCLQGYQVTVIEREPIIAIMLAEAFQRFSRQAWVRRNNVTLPNVVMADAAQALDLSSCPADCVYLDPMFPPKRKKSAAVNKEMQLLQWLLGHDDSAADLVKCALQKGYQRVAVKRPDHAAPLFKEPDTRFSSKLVHYDVYLNASITEPTTNK